MLATPGNTAEAKTIASLLTSLIKSTYHHHQMMVSQQQQVVIPSLSQQQQQTPSSSCSPQHFMQSCAKAFEAPRPPSIPLEDYVQRIYKYSGVSFEVLVCALMYIDRIVLMNPTFLVTERNVHRLFLSCVVLAVKTYEDAFYNNAFYANVGGVPVHEMNKLEIAFLTLIRFELFVDHAAYQQYHMAVASMKAFSFSSSPCSPSSPSLSPSSTCNPTQQQQQQVSVAPVAPSSATYAYHYPQHLQQHQQVQAPATSAASPPSVTSSSSSSMTTATTAPTQCRFRHNNIVHNHRSSAKDNITVMA